jgi:phage-related protein|tara:strand:+ start:786 stop:1127 length:342 start_codon:yes stop_codon:yes gene_type:complete
MATFPDVQPNYGASKKAEPNVRVAQFGSGYSQRSTFGINQDKKVWQLTWQNIGATDANLIEDFLEARAGVEAFDWSPPDDTDTYKWICKSWTKTLPYSNLFNINATFEEVFEP